MALRPREWGGGGNELPRCSTVRTRGTRERVGKGPSTAQPWDNVLRGEGPAAHRESTDGGTQIL